MLVSFFSALIGCLITGAQSLLIYLQGEGVCFNDGCKVVYSLTLVDPLYFNLAGFFYFLIAALGLSLSLIHISEPTRQLTQSRIPAAAR